MAAAWAWVTPSTPAWASWATAARPPTGGWRVCCGTTPPRASCAMPTRVTSRLERARAHTGCACLCWARDGGETNQLRTSRGARAWRGCAGSDQILRAVARIPSEHELVGTMGVSRMTVNRALREMAEQGELVRIAGVGTFVGEQKAQSGLMRVANIADEIRGRGHKDACEILRG